MAKTIANFLVGIGLDAKEWEKGGKNVERSLDGFKSKAGIAGTAIAAAFSAAGLAAISAGKRADEFKLKFSQSDSSMKYAYNLGNAFKRMGADADQAYGAILTAEEKLDRLRSGDKAVFNDLATAGIAIGRYSTSSTGEEMIQRLIEDLPSMNSYQQRVAAQAFGLDAAGMNALSMGAEKLNALMIEVGQHSQNLDAAAEAGRKFNDQMARAGIIMDGIGDKLAVKILGPFTSLLDSFNTFLEKNMPRVDQAVEYAGENAGAISAIGGGLTLASIGGLLGGAGGKLGMKTLSRAGAGARFGGYGAAIAGVGSLLYDTKSSDIEAITGLKNVGKYYRSPSETVGAIGQWWSGRGSNVDPIHDIGADVASSAAMRNYMTPEEVAKNSQEAKDARWREMSRLARSDASVPPPIRIESNLRLDGRVLSKAVQEVNALDNANAISDIQSSVSH